MKLRAYRVENEEWLRAGVYYVRAAVMLTEYGLDLKMEFGDDTRGSEYILLVDEDRHDFPVATCRLHFLDHENAKIERVITLGEYRRKGCGSLVIREAEQWMRERGIRTVFVNAREAALGFYRKLGYEPDFSRKTGSGQFVCIMMQKPL